MAEKNIVLVDASVEVETPTESFVLVVSGNTLAFQEGNGEKSVQAATQGGKPVITLSEDITTKISMIKLETPASAPIMNDTNAMAKPLGDLIVTISGTDPAGNRLGRVMRAGTMVVDPEKVVQNEGTIPLEFKGLPLTPS